MSSGPVCFIVVGQEGQWKIDSVGGNQSADPDAFNPTDSMLNNHVVRSMKDEVQVPADTGLDGCKAALYVMKKRNFDEDSRKCILTLIKYVDNIVYRWCFSLVHFLLQQLNTNPKIWTTTYLCMF